MITNSTTNVSGLLPEEWGPLLIEPVQALALAFDPRVSTQISTASRALHIPVVNVDAAAAWVAEGSEITPADPSISELKVVPAKVAGLTIVSSELANDSDPAAAEMVGQSLARSIAAQVDAAFFGNLSSPAPAGLGALTNTSLNRIVAGTTPTTLDAFAQAIALVEQDGATVTAFVANPADALTVQTLKTASGAATPLLGVDATNGTARQVLGVPLLVSPKVAQGTIYGLAAARNYTVLRQDAEVTSDASVFFTSDRVAVRGILRTAFGFPTPKAVARIALSAS